jgi:CheY-like chemotaxis protein
VQKPDIPIIAQTAYAFSTEKDEIMSIGCSDYISKPIQKAELLKLIEKYV